MTETRKTTRKEPTTEPTFEPTYLDLQSQSNFWKTLLRSSWRRQRAAGCEAWLSVIAADLLLQKKRKNLVQK
jgi:hypothetical protein